MCTDLNETDVISDDGVDAINEVSDEDNQLSSDDCLSFSDLQSLIDESSSGDVIYLSNDYAYDSDVDDEDLFSGIKFERDVEEDSEGYTELFCLEIYGDGHTIYGNGARIFRIAETSFIKIYDLQFVNVDEVFFYYGGAVCNYGYATFTGCSFYNNNVDNDGGAIYNSESGTLYIYDCVFEGNSANNGGAIYNLGLIHSFKEDVDYEGDIPESSFNSNFAYNCGGAIYNEEYATLDYFSFYDNAADKDGGAVYNSESGDISVYESKFYGNAAVNGGSIFNMNCSSVYDSSFSNNRADKSGGAIYNYYDDNTFAVCDVQASKFENNVANRGGAIYNAIVNDCRFTNNTAHKYGSNIYKGVIIGSYGDESKLYKTIKSTGLSINAKKCKAKLSNGNLTNMTLNVIVTSNPNGELISGALVCLELDVQDDFDDFGDFYDLGEESGYYLYAVSNKKGVASFKLPDLNFKEYHFATIFVDGYWGNATIESDLGRLVYVGNSKVRFSNDIVFTYGATGSTNLTLTGASGVKASVANHSEAVVNVDKKSISVSGLEPGKYVLNVETIPKDYYNPVNATLNITVRKIPKVDFTAGIVFDYGSSGTVHMIVDGGIVESKNIEVVGHPEAVTQLANNEITISGLNPGSYTLRVVSTPEEGLEPATGTVGITVKKATAVITATKATVALKKGTLWSIKLVDAKTKKPISNMELTLKVYTGKKYQTKKVKTDKNGVATYQTKSLKKGNHKIVVSGKHAGYNFNTVTSSIKVIKPTPLSFKVKSTLKKDGPRLSITVYKKNTKKPVNGIRIKLLVYTGKKVKTIILKTKTNKGLKGVCAYGTNDLTVGTHKVVIQPVDIKYSGSAKSKMIIKKSAKKYPIWNKMVSGKV